MKKYHCWFALLVGIYSAFLLFPQIDTEKIEAQLAQAKGEARIPYLAQLIEAYRRENPEKAIKLGKETLALLINYPNKKIRAAILKDMSSAFKSMGQLEKAKGHAQSSLNIARENNDKPGEASALESLGNICISMGEFDHAIRHYLSCSSLYKELKEPKKQALTINKIGCTYWELGDYATALNYLFQSLKIFEDSKDQWGISVVNSNIALIYKELKDYEKSLEYHLKSLEIFKKQDDKISIALTLGNIAAIYKIQGKYDEAQKNNQEALKISRELGNNLLTSGILNDIGEVYKELKDDVRALDYFNRSLEIIEKLNDKTEIASVSINIASIYRRMGQYGEAIKKANRALEIAMEINLNKKISSAYLELSQIYEDIKNHEKALTYYKSFKETNDSIFNEDMSRRIANLQKNFEMQKRQKEIEILRKDQDIQKTVLAFLFIFAFLILLLAFVIYTRYRLKAKVTRALQKEIKVRERTELKLRESEEKFRILAEKSVVAIWIIQDNVIKYANPRAAKIFGYPQEELIEKDPLQLVFREDRPIVKKNLLKRISGNSDSESYEFRGLNKEGDTLNLESYGSLTLYEGEPAVLESVIDITRRKKAESELLKSSKMESIGILAGGIAHDFNNLLAVIVGNTSMLKLSYGENNPKMNTYLDNVDRASAQAADLAQKFITFSEGGWLMRKKVKLGNILKDTAHLSPQIKNVSCEISIPPDLDFVFGDERQLRQVITNLLINAHEATPGINKSRITVTAQNITLDKENQFSLKEGKYVKLSVIDKGKGIPDDLLEKVFDPYFSTKNTVNQKGLGMGLALCYSIVKKHEGHINITSKVNKGTTVDLYLPSYLT